MILLSEAVEPKVSSATSTYPAVILKVQNGSSNMFVNLQIYCPATMSGTPNDALYCTNNWLTAPTTPHNGADKYDFKPGGVIVISYSDGNVNSPQFVRWLDIDENIIETNYGYILGNPIVPDAVLSLYDDNLTLGSNILQKAVQLLPYVRLAAMGDKTSPSANKFVKRIDETNKKDKPVSYRKCGRYGIELLSDVENTFLSKNDHYGGSYTGLYSIKQKPNTTFLNICSYLFNKDKTTALKIVNTFNKAKADTKYYKKDPALKNYSTALYIFQAVAGYQNFKKGGKVISSEAYGETEKEDIANVKQYDNYLDNFYKDAAIVIVDDVETFCNRFWYVFDYGFRNEAGLDTDNTYHYELDRIYAIITHNNLFRLKQSWQLSNLNTKILVISAIVATAYPSIEYYILRPENIKNNATKSVIQSLKKYNDVEPKNYNIIAEAFAEILYYEVFQLPTTNVNIKATDIYNNILALIKEVNTNWTTLNNILGETLVKPPAGDSPTSPTTPSTGDKKFIWPLPGFSTITSDYAAHLKRSGSPGIDIAGGGVGASYGKPAVASAAGKVTISRKSSTAGNYVEIDHENGFKTRYMHGSELLVKVGDRVTQGQAVIKVGNTGNVSPMPTASNPYAGTHLHFDMKYNNNFVDPQRYVNYTNT